MEKEQLPSTTDTKAGKKGTRNGLFFLLFFGGGGSFLIEV